MESKKISMTIWPSLVGIKDQCLTPIWIHPCKGLFVFLGCNLEISKYFSYEEKLPLLICMPFVCLGRRWVESCFENKDFVHKINSISLQKT